MTNKRDEAEQSEKFKEGLRIRREVLGDAYVDKALSEADNLTWPLQELVTEMAWGSVWSRDQLSRKERSLLNLGILTALNRPHELEIHLRGALNNGLSREQILEVFFQAGAYCGLPAAIDGVKLAKKVFQDVDNAG